MAERYKIINLLSKDAAGGVYLAEDTMLERKVVYRHIDADTGMERSSTWADDMAAYAGKLCAFQHPNIVTIYDVPIDDSGFSMVTQYIEGETLAERLVQGPIREIGAYRMAVDLLEALHAAHDAGVYHGALHTGSIKRLARATGGYRYLIMDLGLNTLATMVKGEDIHIADPVLLAPELHGEDAEPDERADLFMVGQLCYTALVGGHPFSGKSADECAAAHLAGELPPLSNYVPHLNPDFASWVMQMCSGERGKRPASIDEAAKLLHAIKVVDPDATSGNVPTVSLAQEPVPVATVPMAAVLPTKNQTVPVATLTAKQQPVPVATISGGGAPPLSAANQAMQGSGDFLATSDSSNKTMIIVVVSLVVVVVLAVGLTFLFSSGGEQEEAKQQDLSKVVIPEGVKAHMHEPVLIGKEGDPGIVSLEGEKILDWVVYTGANISSGRAENPGRQFRISTSTAGKFSEAARKMPVWFETGGKELEPKAATGAKTGNAKAGDGWSIGIWVPKQNNGPVLVTLCVFQQWAAFDIAVSLPNRDVVDFQVPKQDPGVLRIPIEIPKPKKGGFYTVKITCAKDSMGDFAMGLNAVVVEKK
ncbi:MAG: serine/threonine protein kinase [Akkermansiaceae bacterium]